MDDFIITGPDIQTLWDASPGQTGTGGLLVDYTSGHRGAAYAPVNIARSSSRAIWRAERERFCGITG